MRGAEVFDAVLIRLKAMAGDEHGQDRLEEFLTDRGFKESDLTTFAADEVKLATEDVVLAFKDADLSDTPMEDLGRLLASRMIAMWCIAWQMGYMAAEEVAASGV